VRVPGRYPPEVATIVGRTRSCQEGYRPRAAAKESQVTLWWFAPHAHTRVILDGGASVAPLPVRAPGRGRICAVAAVSCERPGAQTDASDRDEQERGVRDRQGRRPSGEGVRRRHRRRGPGLLRRR